MTSGKINSDKSKKKRHKVIKIVILATLFLIGDIYVQLRYLFPDNFTFYELDDGTYAVDDYKGKSPYIIIPSSHKGKPVSYIKGGFTCDDTAISITVPENITAVSDCAFMDVVNLKKVSLPETLTQISDSMFEACENLEEVNIPQSVTNIGYKSFYGCKSLKKIHINSGIISIGTSVHESDISIQRSDTDNEVYDAVAFAGCTSIEEYAVDENNQYFTSSHGVLYDKQKTAIIAYPPAKKDSSFDIPESVTRINPYAFSDCSNLKKITIPSGVTEIGICAFINCSLVNNLDLPESITSIGNGAFLGCKSLESVNIPENITAIGDRTFCNCGIRKLKIPENTVSVGNESFSCCKSLTEISIPQKVESIGDNAFYACESMKSIKVKPQNMFYTDIDGVMFSKDQKTLIQYPSGKDDEDCYMVPESVTEVECHAFDYCKLRSVIYPKNLGQQTIFISNCNNLEYLTIPDIDADQVMVSSTPQAKFCFDYCTGDSWAGPRVSNQSHHMIVLDGGWFSADWPDDLTLTKEGYDFIGWSRKSCNDTDGAKPLPEKERTNVYYAVFKKK